jgi:hypothetical protein
MSSDSLSLFLSRERAEALAAWRSSELNVVSLYLPVDESGVYPAILDRLIREAPAADPRARGLTQDLERLSRFVRSRFVPGARRGLCAFSCVKYGVFEAFASPEPFHASLTVADLPELGPLSAARRQYRRFLVLLADGSGARFMESHLGEWEELESLTGDFAGGDLARLSSRAEHWRVARGAELLVLGASATIHAALEPLLTARLRDGLIHEPVLAPDRPNQAVIERIAHNEREARKVRESVLVERFVVELGEGGAVAGLEAVAAALQQGCVQVLLVAGGYAKMGRCCPACGRLSVDHRSCSWCFRATEPVLDIVAELAERAAAAGVEVFRVAADRRLDAAGRIGACLAVPGAARPADVPMGRALRALFATKRAAPPRPGAD